MVNSFEKLKDILQDNCDVVDVGRKADDKQISSEKK